MKKLFLAAFALLVYGGAVAQEAGQIRLSPGFIYGSKAGVEEVSSGASFDVDEKGQIGGSASIEIFPVDRFSVVGTYEIYLNSDFEDPAFNFSSRYSVINIDARYIFLDQLVDLYLMGGVAMAKVDFEIEDTFSGITAESDDSETGFNAGAGILVPLSDTVSFNGQVKYQSAFDGQIVAGVGISFTILQF